MNKEQHQRKIRLINKVVDLYFDTASENRISETTARFADWLIDSDFEEEKDVALYRKFKEICEANTPETEISATSSNDLQKSLADVWLRIREHEQANKYH